MHVPAEMPQKRLRSQAEHGSVGLLESHGDVKTKTEARSYQNSQDFSEEGLGVAAGGD